MIVRANAALAINTDIGGFQTLNNDYAVFQALVFRNPATGDVWTDGAMESALWGLSHAAGVSRVTMLWIDKLQTLYNVPFNCGQVGSYVVMR